LWRFIPSLTEGNEEAFLVLKNIVAPTWPCRAAFAVDIQARRGLVLAVDLHLQQKNYELHDSNTCASMRAIRTRLLIGLAALVFAAVGAEDNDAAKTDQAQLQGEWTMVYGERDGQAFSSEFMKGSKRVTKDDETTVRVQGQLFMKAKFTLDPSKTPKIIDYTVTGGTYTGSTQLGIYELEGDKVKFCFSTPGQQRPTDFSTRSNDRRTSTTWKREKK
jgi:uncharacterized protein (TIGR03067 family)